MSARTWAQGADPTQQSATLAGLHADYILFLLDEVGAMPDAVMASAEAALATGVEARITMAGNPTHLSGPLHRAVTTERALWHIVEINGDPDNPRRAPRVDIQWARDQIAKYGRENNYVRVNVFGEFPSQSLNSLISYDEVLAATQRYYRPEDFNHAARVLGVDVAREGDDSSVIFPRQGLQAFDPQQHRNIDGTHGAGLVARKVTDWDADATFIDDTGGFGASWIDNLRRLGYAPIGIGFASQPNDLRYANKRAEMTFEAVQWIKGGGALPPIPELMAALVQTTYTFQSDRLLIQPKAMLKAQLGYSPDHLDALILTFAQPVMRKAAVVQDPWLAALNRGRFESEYDPFQAARDVVKNQGRPEISHRLPGSAGWRF